LKPTLEWTGSALYVAGWAAARAGSSSATATAESAILGRTFSPPVDVSEEPSERVCPGNRARGFPCARWTGERTLQRERERAPRGPGPAACLALQGRAKVAAMKLQSVVRDCLFLNWA